MRPFFLGEYMAAQLFLLPFRPALDANGLVVPGAQIYFYAHGTSTPQPVYSTSALSVELPNPVVADASGKWPSIYLDMAKIYRCVLKDAGGGVIAERDPYMPGIADDLTAEFQAHAYASASLALATPYPNTAAGLAGTANGDYFSVTTGGLLTVYLNNSGVAQALYTYPTSAALASATPGQGASLVTFESGDSVQDLQSTDPGKGASLIALEGGGTVQDLAGDEGSALVGFLQQGDDAVGRNAQDKMREALSPEDFGAVGDGATSDDAAFVALLAAIGDHPNGQIRLGGKTYALTEDGGIGWNQSNVSMIGQGIDRTVIRQINHVSTQGAAVTMFSCENVLFQDLTFHGANDYGTFHLPQGQTTKNIVFNRVKFTNDAQSIIDESWFIEANGVKWICDTGSSQNVWFIDCIFEHVGRMGVELQNHGTGPDVRISDFYFIRPRFIDVGGASEEGPKVGYGISISGYNDNILIDRPYFDNVRQYCIEMVGASRVKIRDAVVRYDTIGNGLIAATNDRPMYGNEIDGLRWCGGNSDAILDEIPAVDVPIRLDNWNDGVVRNVHLKTTGDVRPLVLGLNYPSHRNLIENNVLECDSPYGPIDNGGGSAGNIYRGNKLTTNASSAGAQLIRVSGSGAEDIYVDGNAFFAPYVADPTDWRPVVYLTGTTVKFTKSNFMAGKSFEKSGTLTIAAGTKKIQIEHEFGQIPDKMFITPRGHPSDGTYDLAWWAWWDATHFNINTNVNVVGDVSFDWWGEVNFGNL